MSDVDFGYGDVDEVMKEQSGSGKYLSFKKGDKGRIIQIRIASEPRYINQHWITDVSGKQSPINCTGDDCAYCGKQVAPKEKLQKVAKWGWIVIDREDEEVKVFTGPTLIARSVKEISELRNIKTKNLMWGDPRTYDLQIERTEEPGKGYYKVTPIVEGKGDLTPEEQEKVANAGYDLMEELKGSKKSDNTGSYGSKSASMETAPDTAFDPNDIPDDLGEGDSEDEGEGMPF
jgi:hypothetical protein